MTAGIANIKSGDEERMQPLRIVTTVRRDTAETTARV